MCRLRRTDGGSSRLQAKGCTNEKTRPRIWSLGREKKVQKLGRGVALTQQLRLAANWRASDSLLTRSLQGPWSDAIPFGRVAGYAVPIVRAD